MTTANCVLNSAFLGMRITQAEMFINRRKKFILNRSLYSNLYQTIGIICNSNILITSGIENYYLYCFNNI
jgi:hypothetical protein